MVSNDIRVSFPAFAKYSLIVFALTVYLFCSLAYLNRPGLYYDEVLFANAAMGSPDDAFVDWQIQIGQHHIPLMLMYYIGALKAYLYAPIFKIFGLSAATVRLPVIAVGLVTLFFTYKCVEITLGEQAALLALILLASDPTFIFSNKLDWGPVSLMMALKMSSLYLFLRWLNEDRKSLLFTACLLLGLGVYDKVIFLWFVAALGISLIVCYRDRIRSRLKWKTVLVSFACFAIPAAPFFIYNLRTFSTEGGQEQVLNTHPVQSLAERFQLFADTFNGKAVYGFVNNEELEHFPEMLKHSLEGKTDRIFRAISDMVPINATLMPPLFVLAVGIILIVWTFRGLHHRREVIFFLSLFTLMLVFILATAQATGPHHAVSLYPFPQIIISAAFLELIAASRSYWNGLGLRLSALAGAVVFSVLVVSQFAVDARYLESFAIMGGGGLWSDAIYDLSHYAVGQKNKTFLLMDWGFANQLLLLSNGSVNKEEAFVAVKDSPADDEKLAIIDSYLTRTNALFVFHTPAFEAFPSLELFKSALGKYGFAGHLVKAFYQRDGRPVYLVYEVSRPEIEAYRDTGHFISFQEAENWTSKSGGALDHKPVASGGLALGVFWGSQTSDSVTYSLSFPRNISDAHLWIRYAFEHNAPQRYDLFLDHQLVDVLNLDGTGGFGYTPAEWKFFKTRIGSISKGVHEITIKPETRDETINLDYFYLCEGECDLKL